MFFMNLFILSIIAFGTCYSSHVQTMKARATFLASESEVTGYVEVDAGRIIVNINLSGLTTFPSNLNANSCWGNGQGLTYHIHVSWNNSHPANSANFDQCQVVQTGQHWDPWFGCGPASEHSISTCECIRGRNWNYNCTYASNPLSCEVGDWSSKYGNLMVNSSGIASVMIPSSPMEVSGNDIFNRSIVFHCGNGARVFCAKFVSNGPGGSFATTPLTNRLISDFTQVNGPTFHIDGQQITTINGNGLSMNCGTSSSGPVMTLHSRWMNIGGSSASASSCSNTNLGGIYDPTFTCIPGSSQPSTICTNSTARCNMMYNYSAQSAINKYYIAMGVLLYNSSNGGVSRNRLQPLVSDFVGRSIKLTCGNSVMCAQITSLSPSSSSSSSRFPDHQLLSVILFVLFPLFPLVF